MLSAPQVRSVAGAVSYYLQMQDEDGHLSEYYSSEGAGVWHGAGAEALGLLGDVSPETFRSLAEGRDPDGRTLVRGAGNQRTRAGWDLTFSAPKSVSVLWGLSDAKRQSEIQAAHDRAVTRAIEHMESRFKLARMGSASQGTLEHVNANLVWSTFAHGTSRELDPQVHTHCFLHNTAQRPDGSWGALDANELFQWKMAMGAAYRAELAAGMRDLGYQIKRDGDAFRIAGVPQDVCEQFSKRRDQIEQALRDAGVSGARASELAALSTRAAKSHDFDQEALRARWADEAAALNFQVDRALASDEVEIENLGPMPTPEELLSAATAMDAVIEARHIWQQVAVAAQHRGLGLDAIKEHVDLVMYSDQIMRLVHPETGQVKYTTRELYALEREIVRWVDTDERAQARTHLVEQTLVDQAISRFNAEAGYELSAEQTAAIRHITQHPGADKLIIGDAGTGKSTVMKAARMAWESAGYNVIGAALAGKAAASLDKDSGIKSSTLARLLGELEPSTDPETGEIRPPRRTLTDRDIIVIDEAGMVDSRTLHRIMAQARAACAKVVQVGDHKQLQAVAAGGLFRLLSRGAARLTEIFRQKDEWAKEAVQAFSRGEAAEALGAFADNGMVHIEDDQRAQHASAVDKWFTHAQEVGQKEVLMLAATNAEVGMLNQAARARMLAEHQLCNEVTIQTRDRTGRPTGKLAVAEGERILFKKNKGDLQKNGDLATVERIEFTSEGVELRVRLDRTGELLRINPSEYAQIKHGYAVTTHASQGATVQRAVVLPGLTMMSSQLIYVMASRFKEVTDFVFTRQQMRDAAEQTAPTDRMVSYCEDIAQKQGVELPEDYQDSFAAARAFLDQYSHASVGATDQPDDRLAELKDLMQAMSKSSQKETTLDYQLAEQTEQAHAEVQEQKHQNEAAAQAEAPEHIPEHAQPEPHQAHELEMTMEME